MCEQVAEDVKGEVSVVGLSKGMYNGVESNRDRDDCDESKENEQSREKLASAEDQERLYQGYHRDGCKDSEKALSEERICDSEREKGSVGPQVQHLRQM